MFIAFSRVMSRYVLLFLLLAAAFTPAQAEGSGADKVWPKRASITGPNGEFYLAIPLRFYLEYGHGQAKSTSDPTSTVDVHRSSYTLGADFMTSSYWFWGAAFAYTTASDNGTQPFVTSLDTDKKFVGGSFYIAKYIAPSVLARISFYYNKGDGQSVYNFVTVNNENSKYYGFSPYIQREFHLSNVATLVLGAGLNFNYATFDYDANIPPTADISSVVARVPVAIIYNVTPNFSVTGMAQLNQILSNSTFNNVPEPDPTTVTLTAGVKFTMPNGVSVYGNVSHDFLDSVFDATRYNVGVSVPFAVLGGIADSRQQAR